MSAKTIWAYNVKLEQWLPVGSSILVPSSKTNLSGITSIQVSLSGISISLTAESAPFTSFWETPSILSLTSLTTLFWTIVVYFPEIVI